MLGRALIIIFELVRMGFRVYAVNMWYHKRLLRKEVKTIYATNDTPYDRSYFHRIFYHLILSSVTNLWFSTLRGKSEKKNERVASFYMGACTPLYDDLYDEYDFDRLEVSKLISQGNAKGYGIIAALGMHFYKEMQNHLANPEQMRLALERVAIAQDASRGQKDPGITEEELRKITYDKGGYSIALYRAVMNNELIENEDEAVYHLGSVIQLTNDLFDLRKDRINGVQTLVTNTKDIGLIRNEYVGLTKKTFDSFKKLDYPSFNKKRFLIQLLLVTGRGMVCLDQLAKAQKKYGGVFRPDLMDRSELVCDMEKPINLIRSFFYALKKF